MKIDEKIEKIEERLSILETLDGKKIEELDERLSRVEGEIKVLISLLILNTTILASLLLHLVL